MSWSPTALCTSSAATDESTPPERAQSTRCVPDLGADALDLLLDHGRGRPRGRDARDAVEEVLEDVLAVRRVHDLGVELDAVEPALRGFERGDRRRRRRARDRSALGRRGDRVAVAHPRGLLLRQALEQLAARGVERRLAELAHARPLDRAAEVERHELGAVADAEHGDAELVQARVDPRRRVGVDRGGPAAQDQRRGLAGARLRGGDPVADELGVDAALAHAARDQLRVLAAEVEHEHRPLLRALLGSGSGNGMISAVVTRGGSSARPS